MVTLEMRAEAKIKTSRRRLLLGIVPLPFWIVLDAALLYLLLVYLWEDLGYILLVAYFVLTAPLQYLALVKALKALDRFLFWGLYEEEPPPTLPNSGFLGVPIPPSLKENLKKLREELPEGGPQKVSAGIKPSVPVMPELKLTKEEVDYLYGD